MTSSVESDIHPSLPLWVLGSGAEGKRAPILLARSLQAQVPKKRCRGLAWIDGKRGPTGGRRLLFQGRGKPMYANVLGAIIGRGTVTGTRLSVRRRVPFTGWHCACVVVGNGDCAEGKRKRGCDRGPGGIWR